MADFLKCRFNFILSVAGQIVIAIFDLVSDHDDLAIS